MAGIPPALDSDTEDVTWALQTAEALWKRNERSDALVWLRRAAQAAGEAEHDDRALELAHDAAELAEWIADPAAAGLASSSGRLRTSSVMTVEEHELIEEPRPTQPDQLEEVVEIAV
ncbi:MAG: hypothetical protein JOZ69_17970, partial [Myxococcales bacterium]|nr:hypothetical protein [Myxococcales bacterium]